MAGSQEALDRFERQTAWPMMALALAIIPLLVVPLLVDLSPGVETTIYAIDWFLDRVRAGVRHPPLPGTQQAVLRLAQHHRSALRTRPVPAPVASLPVGSCDWGASSNKGNHCLAEGRRRGSGRTKEAQARVHAANCHDRRRRFGFPCRCRRTGQPRAISTQSLMACGGLLGRLLPPHTGIAFLSRPWVER